MHVKLYTNLEQSVSKLEITQTRYFKIVPLISVL